MPLIKMGMRERSLEEDDGFSFAEYRGSVGRSGGDSQGAAGYLALYNSKGGSLILEREAQEPSESTGTLTMESLSVCWLCSLL